MITDDIEIGINVKTHIYLSLKNNEGTAPFDVDRIIGVEPTENGSIVSVSEVPHPFSSKMETFNYEVENSCEKISEAILDSINYKTEGIRYIRSLLK